ncbi:hypothetical protein XELAEV_18008072mg [Xenopus laevis]|uniref:Uncharacterized protein n=1 Tax=Xenopus laevis TaxID=8355 RepID=A0A974E1Y1_XENLA|nr:hypothetical protein XELAEV_18008072mg [Xenopus laevis]
MRGRRERGRGWGFCLHQSGREGSGATERALKLSPVVSSTAPPAEATEGGAHLRRKTIASKLTFPRSPSLQDTPTNTCTVAPEILLLRVAASYTPL